MIHSSIQECAEYWCVSMFSTTILLKISCIHEMCTFVYIRLLGTCGLFDCTSMTYYNNTIFGITVKIPSFLACKNYSKDNVEAEAGL